ncbi:MULTISPECIES: TIGR03668 family PPOX class F420-dependent oxidoreductase [Streptomyces]|uniref:TIGR03668 family PPOX class F420-dependent oxidoreductase n=1 Tax=Streptomyces lycii TaxID=2654337 RepID=A0ABQ7FFN9_9ACTN|nr:MULTISPECIES: TIGR03668 family PPOX class F420-dependent oxidoreductase [Streptomyces]KAF4407851.1 TIGR03668 family PPOX class F420-dependent oxidoreductase [Streptomyces lycii]PGH47429.1 TIGR03668 family PPOX class F420-dependent oxidoreductase [Streptomyces sp. Ru87]
MRLAAQEARRRFAGGRVLRLATADTGGHPHLVPATFAVDGDLVLLAVDHKPKRHQDLKRLRNIARNPAVSALVDVYDEDWSRLWWARADGTARLLGETADRSRPLALLTARYPQYARLPPAGPVVEIAVDRWSGWAYADEAGPGRGATA